MLYMEFYLSVRPGLDEWKLDMLWNMYVHSR